MANYHGKKGVVYASLTGTGAASNVLKLSNWSLNMSTDKAETTAFGDTNKTYVQGLANREGSISGFWDDTEADLWTGADSTDGIKLYLYPSSDAATKYFYGPAWLDMSIEVAVDGAIRVSGDFVANGAWGRMM